MAGERRKITMNKTQISCMSKKVLYDYFLRPLNIIHHFKILEFD